jgi:hypothetical protein
MEIKTVLKLVGAKRVVLFSVIVVLIGVGFKTWDKYVNDTKGTTQVMSDSEDSVDLLPR